MGSKVVTLAQISSRIFGRCATLGTFLSCSTLHFPVACFICFLWELRQHINSVRHTINSGVFTSYDQCNHSFGFPMALFGLIWRLGHILLNLVSGAYTMSFCSIFQMRQMFTINYFTIMESRIPGVPSPKSDVYWWLLTDVQSYKK